MNPKLKKVLLAALVASLGAYFGPEVGSVASAVIDGVQGVPDVQAGASVVSSAVGSVFDVLLALSKLTK